MTPKRRSPWFNELASVAADPLLLLWSLYLLLDPVYVFRSGLPQPGDMLIIVLTPLALARWNGRLGIGSLRAVRALMWFVAYTIVSAVLWSFVSGMWSLNAKQGFLIPPIYYIFDALVFLTVLVMYERYRERFVRLTVAAVLVSVVLQFLMTFIYSRGGQLRTYGLFNSSNQLGYFAILAASILLLGYQRARLSTVQVIAGQLCCSYLALLSASRAALASAAILMMVAVLNRVRALLAIGVVAAFFLFIANPFETAIEKSRHRLRTDQSLGFVEERGYDRIVKHPEHLFLGAGEGGFSRYEHTSELRSHEMHSSAGTVIFCYGAVGTLFFALFLRQVIRGATRRRLLLLAPAAAYGLSHQGLRFTLLWVLLALVVMLNDQDLREPRLPDGVSR